MVGYVIECPSCHRKTHVGEIAALIRGHRDPGTGGLLCSHCGVAEGRIRKEHRLQEGGTWCYWIRAVMPLGCEDPYYRPYVRLVAEDEDGPASLVQICYYKTTRTLGIRRRGG